MVTISLLEVTAADAAQNLLVLSSVHSLLGGHGFYAFAYLTYLVSPDAARPRGMLLTARPASGQDDRMDPLQKLAAIGRQAVKSRRQQNETQNGRTLPGETENSPFISLNDVLRRV